MEHIADECLFPAVRCYSHVLGSHQLLLSLLSLIFHILEVSHIRAYRLLHGRKAVLQLPHLVDTRRGGNLVLKVHFRHIASLAGQKTHRSNRLPDKIVTECKHQQQTEEDDGQHKIQQLIIALEEVALVTDDSYCPSRIPHLLAQHKIVGTVQVGQPGLVASDSDAATGLPR